MVQSIPPSGSNVPPGSTSSQNLTPASSKAPSSVYGSGTAQPMTFLGMHFTAEESKKLWYAIMQQVSATIQQEQKRALKAIRKLRKSESE